MRTMAIAVAVIIVVLAAFLMYRSKGPVSENVMGYNESEVLSQKDNNTVEPQADAMENTKKLNKPEITIDVNKSYKVALQTTAGEIIIALNSKDTPVTSNNFIYLANNNFYNDTIFHRVIKGFMIQGGDPTGTGTGSPGYKFDDEPFGGEYLRGAVAMANSGPNTNGSQFFIMHEDNPLPKNYVIFGKVISGMEVVDKIATAETTISFGGEKSKPVNPVKIISATTIEE